MDGDTGACFVQASRDGCSNAACASRDQCNLAFQSYFLMC